MSWNDNDRDARIHALTYVVGAFVCLSIVGLFVSLLAFNMTDQHHDTDAIAISLTALEVVLALFAIMLGVVAIFGFWAVRGAAVAAAKREARVYLEEKAAGLFEEAAKTRQSGPAQKPVLPADLDTDDILEAATEETEDGK